MCLPFLDPHYRTSQTVDFNEVLSATLAPVRENTSEYELRLLVNKRGQQLWRVEQLMSWPAY
jgi:hypothetical protein